MTKILSTLHGLTALVLIVVIFALSLFVGRIPYARKIAWSLIAFIAVVAAYNQFKGK